MIQRGSKLTFIILIAALVVGLVVLFYSKNKDEFDQEVIIEPDIIYDYEEEIVEEIIGDYSKISKVNDQDHIRGGQNPEIVIIEYSDFQCPFCGQFYEVGKQLVEHYGGKVQLVYRHLPLNSTHPEAEISALASECAAEQGKFWEMHDKLFENQNALDSDSLKKYASQIGLDQNQFDSCLDSGKYLEQVVADALESSAAGIYNTPGIFIQDQYIEGFYPFDRLKNVIDLLLAGY